MGQILDMARIDAKFILSAGGFETDITITKEDETQEVKGLGIVHHVAFDTEGNAVNSKQARVTICELDLTDITVRDANGDVVLRNALIEFKDITGVSKSYIVRENYADDTIGCIVLILGKYAE